ncbi:TetR/AcrR family transcriptional regulator [Actinoplanes philippinensis]|uniref:TetR/AcrR family transcriptional regulator n=1 Tax=Actinoplanes philippinensis TaxID=35752 RepID=UPI0033E75767
MPNTQPRSRRSPAKQTAILDGAEELFTAQGYNAVGIDAIASRAAVSTRTLYDHFGNKEGLWRAVVDRVTGQLMRTIRTALDETLPPGFDPATGLLTFARRIVAGTFASSDFVRFRRLAAASGSAALSAATVTGSPLDLLETHMRDAIDRRELVAASAQRATSHFVGLTFLLALDLIDRSAEVSDREVDELLVDGVAAFLRAYRAGPAVDRLPGTTRPDS